MKPKTDRSHRLVFWLSISGVALLVSLSLLFWAGSRGGETPSPIISPQPAAELAGVDVRLAPAVVETSSPSVTENGSEPEEQLPDNPRPTPPTSESESMPDEDSPPDNSDQAPLQSLADDSVPKLPNDWDRLSPADKVNRNPFGCDLSREEINLEDGRCRQRSTPPPSQPKPWSPTSFNLVSTTEVENRPLKISCYNQDLSHLLNSPSLPANPGGIDWEYLINSVSGMPSSGNGDATSRSSVSPNNNPGNNRGFRHCILRVTLKMTIDGFYFPNGCRTWRPGFVKLVGIKGGEVKTYGNLSTPGPNVLCTKNTVPIAKGQQLTQIFLFDVPDSELNFKLTQIRFDWLEPKLILNGNFGFRVEPKPLTFDPLQLF